jgi:hypothetical protein
LQHKGTSTVLFENRRNLMKAVNNSLDLCVASCIEGYPMEITIGCCQQEAP